MYTYIRARIGELDLHISALCMFAYLYLCRSSFLVVGTYLGISSVVAGLIIVGFTVAFLVYTFTNPDKICLDGLAVTIAIILFFYITILIHPEYASRYRDLAHEGRHSAMRVFKFGGVAYVYYLIRLFRDEEEKLMSVLKAVAFTILLCDSWSLLTVDTVKDKDFEYSMTFGYQMALAAILFMVFYFYENYNISYFILSLICMMIVVVCGSRASVIGYVVFFGIYYIWKRQFGVKQLLLMLLAAIGVIIYNSQGIVRAIYDIFASIGLRSRTLYFIASGDILAEETARQDSIWPDLMAHIKEMSLFKSYGAFGDRYLLEDRWVYAHNLFLEVILSFGILAGGALLIWIVYQFIQVIRKNRDAYGLVTIAFGSFSLCRLFFSSTIWEEPNFWIFLAMLVNCAIRRKRGKVTEEAVL